MIHGNRVLPVKYSAIIKYFLIFLIFGVIFISDANAWPTVIASGISKADHEKNEILEEKYTWSSSESADWLVAWIKINDDISVEDSEARYFYKIRIISPGGEYDYTEGPFGFDSTLIGMKFAQVSSFLNTRRTPDSVIFGIWKIDFYLFDIETKKEQLAKELQFNLAQ